MVLDIRPVSAQDKPQWAQLWYAYLDFYDTSLPLDVYDATFAALLSDDPHSPCGYMAWQDDQATGLAHYLFHAHCWQPEGVCYLQDLFTTPETRGMGVGRALISAVYGAADARGVKSVYWMTQDFNATARKLYDKVGEVTPFIKYKRPS
ncbi:GNAT family N-acetyltransferase [Roseinatronobacter alkalisoli]|uniref:GNAT family N-acetyltransferase n=1 Tax=Roseinatronobacter alkalisoli TaxID=3028235 RepID=A0ABT5T5S1_9RHOB|nr:GNAT family N-acetyltransferase [Roseinatronobacter sp. HJB301]MDD7970324.1 GNAT family N-acetyltransferase [Roseinatronobacter sp. HJB301]